MDNPEILATLGTQQNLKKKPTQKIKKMGITDLTKLKIGSWRT